MYRINSNYDCNYHIFQVYLRSQYVYILTPILSFSTTQAISLGNAQAASGHRRAIAIYEPQQLHSAQLSRRGWSDGIWRRHDVSLQHCIYSSCWVAQVVVEENMTNLQLLTLATLNIVYDDTLYCTSTKYCESLLVGAVAIILHTKLRGCFQS